MCERLHQQQGHSSRIFIGPAKSLPFPSPSFPPFLPSPPFPFPSPPFSFPSRPSPSPSLPLRSRPAFLRLGGLGERSSSPSRSGQSPAAKRILVHFELKSRHLVASILMREITYQISSIFNSKGKAGPKCNREIAYY